MIDSESDLRRLYAAPTERVIRKQLDRLDRHCCRFIELSPFVVIASGGGMALLFPPFHAGNLVWVVFIPLLAAALMLP